MLSPEESQFLSDLRIRMEENIKKNLPSHTGLNEEEVRRGLDALRQNRTAAGVAGARARKKKDDDIAAAQIDTTKRFPGVDFG